MLHTSVRRVFVTGIGYNFQQAGAELVSNSVQLKHLFRECQESDLVESGASALNHLVLQSTRAKVDLLVTSKRQDN